MTVVYVCEYEKRTRPFVVLLLNFVCDDYFDYSILRNYFSCLPFEENFGYKNVLLNKVALLNYMHALQQFTGL